MAKRANGQLPPRLMDALWRVKTHVARRGGMDDPQRTKRLQRDALRAPLPNPGPAVHSVEDLPTDPTLLDPHRLYRVIDGESAGNDAVVARATVAGVDAAAQIYPITPVLTTRTTTSGNILTGATATVTANCNAGEICIAGGYVNNASGQGTAAASRRSGTTGWVVAWHNEDPGTVTITVEAYCLATPLA